MGNFGYYEGMATKSPTANSPDRSSPHGGHEVLRLGLMSVGLRMWEARGEPETWLAAHDDLVRFCFREFLPHLEADEGWLHELQNGTEGRLLAEAMLAEARTMAATVDELTTSTDACESMALTRVLHALLAAHDHHEKLLSATSPIASSG